MMMKMKGQRGSNSGIIGLTGNPSPNLDLLKDKSSATEIRLLLHTSHAGGLIGKGGLRITALREVN